MAPPRGRERMDICYRSYNRIRNVGDAITPYILEELTGFAAAAVSHDVPHVLGVGSILFMATASSHVWGCGALNARVHIPEIAPARISALRGKRTVELLRGRGMAVPDVPLGDPGIFAAEVLARGRDEVHEISHRAAVLPHHGSLDHPFFRALRDSCEFRFVNVLDDTLEPLRQIARAEVVISQSLHGLIFAESLGKPSLWIGDQDNPDWNFKFEDWFSTTANPQGAPVPLTAGIEEMIRRAEPRRSTIDKAALRRALPVAGVIHDLAAPLDFRFCRESAPVSVSVPRLFGAEVCADFAEVKRRFPGIGFRAFEVFRQIFSRWAERAYLCLQPADVPVGVTHAQLRVMCAHLDHALGPDYACILDRSRVEGWNLPERALGGGVSVVEGPGRIGGALLLRPDFGGLSERFVTFLVQAPA